jgi:CRP-like cAMP-binding protein
MQESKHPSDLSDVFPKALWKRRAVGGKEWLFRRGDPSTAIYEVESGAIRLEHSLDSGGELLFDDAGAGAVIGETSLLIGLCLCDARAVAPSEIRFIPRAAALSHLRANGQSALNFAAYLAREVTATRKRLELLRIRPAEERLLRWLLVRSGGKNALRVDISWKDVASEIGLAHETLYRALARLEEQERVRRKGRSITIVRR